MQRASNKAMEKFRIDIAKIEEWQTIADISSLGKLFQQAKSAIVNGNPVLLVRNDRFGKQEPFDEFSTLEDLDRFRQSIFKYL